MTALLSPPAIVAGLALLAGTLWLLQRLRVRHRPVRVPSTLFWREALEEARARVFVERFRHPLAYLLLLAIGTALWLAAAGLDFDRRAGERHLVLLDGSARMAAPGRFEAAAERVREVVRSLPRERRQVILAAGEPRTLLAPGEHERLLALRLAAHAPAAAPSSLDRAAADHLGALAAAPSSVDRATLWVAGDSSLSPSLLASLPDSVTVVDLGARSEEEDAEPPPANRGIAALGLSPASSGAWERVDLFAEVAGNGAAAAELSLTLDGSPLPVAAERSAEGGSARYLVRDLPAAGGRLEAALAGADANSLDDRAARALPVRAPIRVMLSPALEGVLGPALAADPAVRLVESGADVAVRRAGEPIGAGLPALELVPRGEQEESILLAHGGGDAAESAAVLDRALVELGIDQVDAMELAAAAGRPITIGARPSPGDARGRPGPRAIGVWEELLSTEYDFVSSRSFPLFVALSLRWLLEVRDFPAEVAAGRPLPSAGRLAAGGLVLDPVGVAVRPPRAGEYSDERGDGVSVALLDPATSDPRGARAAREASGGSATEDAPATRPPGAPAPLASLLALAAFLLLAVEWLLHRLGRVP